ncbi:MAG: hypothetical protein NOF05_13790 [Candidatus Accumulibacter phosphatis]|nr:hypothetical protein [Candidatus Accumulibacter phosphatis]
MQALATGVLLSHGGHDMVVTASHVLDSPDVQRQGAYILHDRVGFIDLGDFSFIRTDSAGDRIVDDALDIAVLFLEPGVAQTLRNAGDFEFATLSVTDDEGLSVPCAHFIHGFPLALTRPGEESIARVSLACFLPLATDTEGCWKSDFPEAHLDLEYNRDLLARVAGTGDGLSLPTPEGFSGCGIWRVPLPGDGAVPTQVQAALVGIVHRFNPSTNTIRATRLEALLSVMFAAETTDPPDA